VLAGQPLRVQRMLDGLQAGDRLLAVTTLSFDIAVLELFLPLVVGASVCIADRETARDPRRLAGLIASARIGVMQATPSSWRLLLDDGWDGGRNLVALSGGEAFPPELAARLRPRVARLFNLYGPTETTVCATWELCDPEAPGAPTIGRPIANMRAYLLDRHGEPIGAINRVPAEGQVRSNLARGGRAEAVRCDITDRASVDAAVARTAFSEGLDAFFTALNRHTLADMIAAERSKAKSHAACG